MPLLWARNLRELDGQGIAAELDHPLPGGKGRALQVMVGNERCLREAGVRVPRGKYDAGRFVSRADLSLTSARAAQSRS